MDESGGAAGTQEAVAMAQRSLENYWHPIARCGEVSDQPRRFHLLGTELVAFRDDDGVAVFKDVCIHRGSALSLGSVIDGRLRCAYHGWEYDRAGTCVKIPSLPPGSSVPNKARAIAYRVEERYDLVWVAIGEPVAPIPVWPRGEFGADGYHTHLSSVNIWRTNAGRATESFMDYSHFPFVHPNLLAPPDQTLVPDAEIEQTEYGLKYQYETVEPESPSSKEGDVVVFEYYLYFPFTVHVKKVTPDGGETYVSLLTSPQQHNLTTLYIIFVRNYALDTPDDSFDHFSNRVLEQDRRIVESQRPEQIPLDLREELHLKVPDAATLAYRELLGELEHVGEYMP